MRKEQEAKGWLRKALSGEHSRPTGNPAVLRVVLRSTTASPFPPSLTFIPVIFGLPLPPHITPYFFPSKTNHSTLAFPHCEQKCPDCTSFSLCGSQSRSREGRERNVFPNACSQRGGSGRSLLSRMCWRPDCLSSR